MVELDATIAISMFSALAAMSCGRGIEPIVDAPDGLLRGRVAKSKSSRGGKYFSFQGIPYAQPPVGNLRFTAPQRVQPWTGIKDALKEASICSAFDSTFSKFAKDSNEDCLYLNVYTNKLPGGDTNLKRPVMVWIHGGGYMVGSGNTDFYGPDHLVVRDVVVVTINYRLGVLGFLSLQNEACPGNNGLKDQVEALRWVKRNIMAFGGDPDNVTIFGESAGASSVQYLMISPLTKGLFHRAISQSGSALNPWAKTEKPVLHAFKLAEILGRNTTDKDTLLEFLRQVPVETLVTVSMRLLRETEPDIYYLKGAFNPCVEPQLPDAFLSEPAEDVVQQGRLHDVPYMVGVNTLEGLIICAAGIKPLQTDSELERLLPIHPNLKRGTPLADSILQQIKEFYFPNGWDDKKSVDVLSSLYFLFGNEEVLRALGNSTNRKSKTFFYVFTYDGGLGHWKKLLGFSSWKGTMHSDEVSYLMYSHAMGVNTSPGSADDNAIDRMCKLWIDFATTGDPTPENKLWQDYDNLTQTYLDIGETLTTKNKAFADQMEFWRGVFAQINEAVNAKL